MGEGPRGWIGGRAMHAAALSLVLSSCAGEPVSEILNKSPYYGRINSVSEKEICISADIDQKLFRHYFENRGWNIETGLNRGCQFSITYNKEYNDRRILDLGHVNTFNVEKCIFDISVIDNSIIYFAASALISKNNSAKNCALRALLTLEGVVGALDVKDEQLRSSGFTNAESALIAAVRELPELPEF